MLVRHLGSLGKPVYLIAVIAILVALLPGVVLGGSDYRDSYLNFALAVAEVINHTGRIDPVSVGSYQFDPGEHGHNGYPVYLTIWSQVLGVPGGELSRFPWWGLLVAFTFYAVAVVVLKSPLPALCFALFALLDPMLARMHSGVFAYTWAHVLLAAFLLVVVRMQSVRTVAVLLAAFILFVGSYAVYWTSPLWIIVLMLVLAGIHLSSRRQERGFSYVYLLLAFMVIYLGFSQIFYHSFVPSLMAVNPWGEVQGYLESLISLFLHRQSAGQDFAALPSGDLRGGWLLFTRYLLILGPILIGLGLMARSGYPGWRSDPKMLLCAAVLVTGVVHSAVYLLQGHISLRFMLVFYPLVTFYFLLRLFKQRVAVTVAGLLLLVAALGFGYNIWPLGERTFDIRQGIIWSYAHGRTGAVLVTDLETMSRFVLVGAEREGEAFRFQYYHQDHFQALFADRDCLSDYVAVNMRMVGQNTLAGGWVVYEPLQDYLPALDGNDAVNRLYDSAHLLLYGRRS